MKNFLAVLCIFSFGFAQVPSTWWVDGANGDDRNDGRTEATAFKTIQNVFNSYLLGNYTDTIKVNPGTYDFSSGYISNANKPFIMVGTGGASQTILDSDQNNRFIILSFNNEDAVTVFDGLTFKDGLLPSNQGSQGGAVAIYGNTLADFRNCIFENNKADYSGGAVYVGGSATVNFESCIFTNNEAGERGGAIDYDPVYNDASLRNQFLSILKSQFYDNKVKSDGDGSGGAIFSSRQVEIVGSVFARNFAQGEDQYQSASGGAIALDIYSWDQQQQTSVGGDARIINSTFDGNFVTGPSIGMGGTISYGGVSTKVLIFNSIISNSAVFLNGTIFEPTDDYNGAGLVVGTYSPDYNKVYADYSSIQDAAGEDWAGNGVYDIDPGYTDRRNQDFSLSDKSPLIGVGVDAWNDWGLKAPDYDINGVFRPTPLASDPDLGAYENANGTMAGPMPPSNFTLIPISYGAKLSWSPSTKSLSDATLEENIEYKIFQDNRVIATVKDTLYTVRGLSLDSTYAFSIAALKIDDATESVKIGPLATSPSYLGPWYVAVTGGKSPNDASNTNEYGSINFPINHLTNAIDVAAAGDTIVMLEGTHSGVTNRNLNISKRLVITGDLTKSPDEIIIDAEHVTRHFTFDFDIYTNNARADSNWVIQHLTLYRGKASYSLNNSWFAAGGSVRLTNSHSPKFYNVIFRENRDESGAGWSGAAIFSSGGGPLNIDKCQFIDNVSIDTNGDVWGGAIGISSWGQGRSIIKNSIFKGNQSIGKYNAAGSAIATNSPLELKNNLVYNNTVSSEQGTARAAIFLENVDTEIVDHSVLVNNTVANNNAVGPLSDDNSSGIYVREYYYDQMSRAQHIVYAFNNIIYGNAVSQIISPLAFDDAIIRSDHNLIQNLDQGIVENPNLTFDYSFDFDPAFKDTANGDFSLSDKSLALGKGVSEWNLYIPLSSPNTDIIGKNRPFPSGTNPDLGAYENNLGESLYPPAIQGLVGKGGSGQITLNWNALVEADSVYKIYQSDQPFSVLSNENYVTSTTSTTYTASGLDNAKTYYFKVTAVNKAGYESSPAGLVISPTHTGPVWWIATDGSDQNGDGSAGGPLASIQNAMEKAASGDTIMLKPGTYFFDEITYPLQIHNDITGGFTLKSFDSLVIRSQKGASSTTINAQGQGRHFNLIASDRDIDSSFQFIGLTFRGGYSNERGGSFTIESISQGSDSPVVQPKFTDCVFTHNSASDNEFVAMGGAIYTYNASPVFENCIFDTNFSNRGGAIFSSGDIDDDIGPMYIRNSIFRNNSVQNNDGNPNSMGGAIFIQIATNIVISGSTFSQNRSYSDQGHAEGGAIFSSSFWDPSFDKVLDISNSRFTKNEAVSDGVFSYGGALSLSYPFIMTGSVVDSNFAIGQIDALGGGIYNNIRANENNGGFNVGFADIINNSIVNNVTQTYDVNQYGTGGGMFVMAPDGHDLIMFNNIIWGNSAEESAANGIWINGMEYENDHERFLLTDGYNNIQDQAEIKQMYNFDFGENTISVNPGFKTGSYQLSDISPMIGAGISVLDSAPAPSIDIGGNRRPTPSGSNPDLGAYENALSKSPYPDQVINLVALETSNAVELEWSPNNALNIKHYNVYYSMDITVNTNELTKVTSTQDTTYVVKDLLNGVEYHFMVSAVDSSNFEGPLSETVSATPKYDGPNWWVNPSLDQDGDGTFGSPFSSMQRAVPELAERGDTIRIVAGNFSDYDIFISGNEDLQVPAELNQSLAVKDVAIIGAGPLNTVINGEGRTHFIFQDVEKIHVQGMTLSNGFSLSPGGSVQSDNVDTLIFSNVVFSQNQSRSAGGAIDIHSVQEAVFSNVAFNKNTIDVEELGFGSGGAVNITNMNGDEYGRVNFVNCEFIENGIIAVETSASGSGSAIESADMVGLYITESRFERNYIDATSGANSTAIALINVTYAGSVPLWNNIPSVVIEQSFFNENYTFAAGLVDVSFLKVHRPLVFRNNLVVNNYVPNNNNANQMIALVGEPDQGGNAATSLIANNTFYGNSGNNGFVNVPFGDLNFINNIVWSNNSIQSESNRFIRGNTSTIYAESNILQSNVEGSFVSVNNIDFDPKLRNPESGDYSLQVASPAIDTGVDFGNVFDYRGYYRVGIPDIGALEAGASKYILAIEDDLVGSQDTTFVTREDTLEFTVTTNDIDGNIVNSSESVTWSIFPSAKYVNLLSSDATTSGGSATARFKVSEEAKSKGFRFRIIAEVGEGIMRSEMYVIEELVTGAPPPVPVLTITPDTWSTEPNFTLSWTIPNWSEGRDLLGAIVEIDDGINFYDEFIGFPENNPLKAYAFSVPEPGAFDASIRLMDEYGNEDPDSSKSIQALYDDVQPGAFNLNFPNSHIDQIGNIDINWASDKPRFKWQNVGDYPSGIEKWVLYINGEEFGAYYEESIEFIDEDAVVQDTSKSLEDGTYDWYVKTIDYAGNATNSDTGYFGVDLNPPLIIHNNPLTIVDEGSTTPSINVEVSDGGSGVKDVYLNYRRSGSNSGFVTVPLWNDGQIAPSSIPGSDIRSEGVEYFIEAVDELGNYSEWPYDYNGKYVQSVAARTQNNVTTADYWSAGIPTGTDTSAYQLFSIPFNTNKGLSAITEVLGPPDEFKYRLFGWNNGWNEFTETNPLNIGLGDAYFFIWDKEQYPDVLQLNFDFGTGESTPTAPPFEIPAAAGEWKFFGNPYNFPVNLINVRTQADVPVTDEGSIYTWSSFGGWINPGSNLEPWKGYIYKSASDPDIYVDGTGDVFGKRLAKTTTPDINNISMDANEWVINILASTGRSRDESNSVGVLNIASDGYDRLDEFEPPVVPGNISLSINNRDRVEVPDVYSIDIRKPNEEGHYWDLEVITPTNGKRTYLTFEGLGYVPDEYDIFIINKTNKQAQNLKWESGYRFANTGPDSYLKQDLRLVIGSKKFVEKNNAGVSLYPDAFVLSQNYPNPFNPQTSIMISLQEEAQVDLVIYNLLGEQITRLSSNEIRPAGYYNFIWNGMNASGNKVSTGVYLYHAMVKDRSGKMVLNKTKKMVFLK